MRVLVCAVAVFTAAAVRAADLSAPSEPDADLSSGHVALSRRPGKPGYRDARKYFPKDANGYSAVDLQAALIAVSGEASADPREQCVVARSILLRAKDPRFGCEKDARPLLCVVGTPGQYAGYAPEAHLDPELARGAAAALKKVLAGDNCSAPPYEYFCAGALDDVYAACGTVSIGKELFLERKSCDQCREDQKLRAIQQRRRRAHGKPPTEDT